MHHSFGMNMPGRNYSAGSKYRYGFNGKELDKEVASNTTYDYGFRIYNPALGKFLSVDPFGKNYLPFYSPYIYSGNKPIAFIDNNGLVEIHIIHNIYAKDGTTLIRTYTNKIIVQTVEDIRGIERSTISITITEKMTTVPYVYGNATFYNDEPKAQFYETSGGESYEDIMWSGWDGKLAKFVYKTLKKFWPPAKINDAFVKDNGNRDPITNEIRYPLQKYIQAAEGIIDAVTIGKAPFSKDGDGLKKLAESQLKRVIDWGAEEIMKLASEKLGLDKAQTTILGYYTIKYAYEGANGKLKDLYKKIEALVKIGTKGTEAVNELSRAGYALDLPQDKSAAIQAALNFEKQGSLKEKKDND